MHHGWEIPQLFWYGAGLRHCLQLDKIDLWLSWKMSWYYRNFWERSVVVEVGVPLRTYPQVRPLVHRQALSQVLLQVSDV